MTSIHSNLTRGNRLPHGLRGAGREAVVVLNLHIRDCEACSAYTTRLAHTAAEIAEWDGRVIELRDVDTEAPAVIIADQWGEIGVAESAGDAHHFMEPSEVVTWLRYLAMKCPECEGEAL
jgi:hypothetical protein